MNEAEFLLHAIKDAAIEIRDLNARVGALEKRLEINAKTIQEFCPCIQCAIERSDRDNNF